MEEMTEEIIEQPTCYHCGDIIDENNNELTDVDNNRYCRLCFETECYVCDECGDVLNRNESGYHYMHYEETICDNCYESHYGHCDGCGGTFRHEDLYYDNDHNNTLCDDCYSENDEEGRDGMIYDYHAFKSWRNLGNDSNLRFGFELEVEQENSDIYVNDAAKKVCQIMNNEVICSHDGSIDCGFEIVSHPMTFNYLLSRTDSILEMLKYLSTIGYRSHEPKTCGLHVHVTRAALGDSKEEQDRVINNILMIFENFINELTLFSRRQESQLDRWAQFISKYSGFNGEILSMKFISDKKDSGNRYMAVNLNNRNTIEFRLFRGTLNPNTFMATFYLLNNIIKKAQQKTINGLTWDKIIGKNKVLRDYCNLRGIESNVVANELIIKFENKKPKKKLASIRNNAVFDSTEMAADTLDFARRSQRQAQTAIERAEYEREQQRHERERIAEEAISTITGTITTNYSNNNWELTSTQITANIIEHHCNGCDSVTTCSLSDGIEYRHLTEEQTRMLHPQEMEIQYLTPEDFDVFITSECSNNEEEESEF